MWDDPGSAAQFSASVPTLPAEIDAKGGVAVSICRVGGGTVDGTNAAGRAGASDGARVGEVVWLRSRVSAAGCIEALCNDTVSGERGVGSSAART